MNYFLILVVVVCGGYYGYTTLETRHAADLQAAKMDLQSQIEKLEADNKTLTDDNLQLNRTANEDKAVIAALTGQAQAVQRNTQAAMNPGPAGTIASQPPVSSGQSNQLGDISTLDGKSYGGCQLLKVDTGGITISYAAGITKLSFVLLPPELQKRFGFDPKVGGELPAGQAELQEEMCKAAMK